MRGFFQAQIEVQGGLFHGLYFLRLAWQRTHKRVSYADFRKDILQTFANFYKLLLYLLWLFWCFGQYFHFLRGRKHCGSLREAFPGITKKLFVTGRHQPSVVLA